MRKNLPFFLTDTMLKSILTNQALALGKKHPSHQLKLRFLQRKLLRLHILPMKLLFVENLSPHKNQAFRLFQLLQQFSHCAAV